MFAVRIEETYDGIADAPIDNNLMTLWNVDLETIKASAFKNISNQKPIFMSVEKALFEGKMNDDIFDLDNINPSEDEMPLNILSNKHKTQGASIIFNKALMTRIAEKIGKYYILPSSIHEVLIVPAISGNSAKELAQIVKRVNEESISERDKLSDNVYEYGFEAESIKIA